MFAMKLIRGKPTGRNTGKEMISVLGMSSKTAPASQTPVCDLEKDTEDDPVEIVDALFRRQDEEKLLLNVRGSEYAVDLKSLERAPNSTLALIGRKWKEDSATKRRPVFINRKPAIVECLLDFYETGELHIPDGLCAPLVHKEMQFWGLGCDMIMPCCLGKLKDTCSTLSRISDVHRHLSERRRFLEECHLGWRGRLWAGLEYPDSGLRAKIFALCMVGVMAVWVLVLCLQSMKAFQQTKESGRGLRFGLDASKQNLSFGNLPMPIQELQILDVTLLLVVTCVTLLRIVVSPCKVYYFKCPINVVEVISLLLQLFFVYTITSQPWWIRDHPIPFGLIMCLRSVPVVRSVMHLRGLRIMVYALKDSSKELGLLLLMILLGSVILGMLVYAVELGRVNNQFNDIPEGIWWGVITFTTVGYGDVFPETMLGRLVGGIGAIAGILIIALPVPIIASNFSNIREIVSITEQHMRMVEDRKRKGKGQTEVKYKGWPGDVKDMK